MLFFQYNSQLGTPSFEVQYYSFLYQQWIQTPQPSGWKIWDLHAMIHSEIIKTGLALTSTMIVDTWINTGRARYLTNTTITFV